MENKNKNISLKHATWKQLVELTAYISENQFHHILGNLLHVRSLDELTEDQALDLIETLSVLPKLKQNLLNGLRETTESIVQNQLDIFAEQLIAGNDRRVDV